MNRNSNSSVFHFTRTPETLCAIVNEGLWPRYCMEDIRWQGHPELYHFVAFPMVSFCDLPLSRITDHVEFYGSYGIGLSKEWATRAGLNPVFYLNPSSTTKESLLKTFEFSFRKSTGVEESSDDPVEWIRHLISFVKPLRGQMRLEGDFRDKEFYTESEWRYIPKSSEVRTHLTSVDFENPENRASAEALTKAHALLKFEPEDIRHIFVPGDNDIPRIANFIQEKMDRYPAATLKILATRLTSLETVLRDI